MTLPPQPPAAAPPAGAAEPPYAPEYPVFYQLAGLRAAVAAARRNRNWRLGSLALSGVILAVIWWFFRDAMGGLSWQWVLLMFAVPLAFLAAAIVREVRARRAAASVPDGLALGIGRLGVLLPDGFWPWEDVAALDAVALFGGWKLRITTTDGGVILLPLLALSVKPATLDNAVRALSGGRHRVDFTALRA